VLLVHGASASSRTFEVPAQRPALAGGLTAYLIDRGWDVWLLDWRSSGTLAAVLIDDGARSLPPQRFNLDEARDDLVVALERIAEITQHAAPIPIVGHCIGGALVAHAVATLKREAESRIGNIVLTTLGLFFSTSLDDWVKGHERFLEEVWWMLQLRQSPADFFISPWVADKGFGERHTWPPPLEEAYQIWKETPLPHGCDSEFCRRACFMFGMPYRSADMMELHDEPQPAGLWRQFGRMPLATYMHCVQNLRRGWVAPWQVDDSDTSCLNPEPFARRKVTLITGEENQVWHRDSIDRMYEWLRRELDLRCRPHIRKHVLRGYGHQDLYWSAKAHTDVYPLIAAGLN
jgi:pimeloyl-ACP methyl ester carboxylesterase